MIAIDHIRIDGGTQARAELNQDVVAEYAEAYKSGAQMPPVVLIFDGALFWLADGFHRYFAAKAAGLTEIHEERRPGTQRDAVLFSLRANANHGLRRSNADKRKAVQTLLADPEWTAWSDSAVAKACGVSDKTVAAHRKPIFGNSEDAPAVRTVTRNGSTYQQNVENIGVKLAKDEAAPVDSAATQAMPEPTKPAIINGECERLSDQGELDDLRDRYEVMADSFKETLAENESMARVFDANDKVVAAMVEAKRFREMNTVLESRIVGLLTEKNEAIRLAKSFKCRAEKAEALLAKEGAQCNAS